MDAPQKQRVAAPALFSMPDATRKLRSVGHAHLENRRPTLGLIATLLVVLGALVSLLPASAGAQEERDVTTTSAAGEGGSGDLPGSETDPSLDPAWVDDKRIDVVKVDGVIDPVTASMVSDVLTEANANDVTMVLLQIDASGVLDVDIAELTRQIRESDVPVLAWVGPSGATASGGAVELVAAAHLNAIADGASIGDPVPSRLDRTAASDQAGDRTLLEDLLAETGRPDNWIAQASDGGLDSDEAVKSGLIEEKAVILGEAIVGVDGQTVETAAGPVVLSTARTITDETTGVRRQSENQQIRFLQLGLAQQLQHTLVSPRVAYLLLLSGLALILFEYYASAVGLASATGALALVGAFFGMSHLPVNTWAVVLICLAFICFAVEVQAGTLGPYTALGTAFVALGSTRLFSGPPAVTVPWWLVIIGTVATVLFVVGGMTAMVRSRFGTPTVGREGLIGREGVTQSAVAAKGVVIIDGAPWRAVTNRARPLEAGVAVRVVAIQGLEVEVEPLSLD
ncbi:MAG: hypothetical protein KAZ88_01375 [Acidimicrobiia bacterium]|jgi:membrane-bound serine protease (ClpP class)|nr:hypothetical protein [Acidimicrobiia bacterium]MBP8179625.1 hypothetical protein [Acidimicrobiia bacterium]